MKLYYSRGASSLAPHIIRRELQVPHELVSVDLPGQKYGRIREAHYFNVNAKGKVPALLLDDGEVLTECSAILVYLAEFVPGRRLLPERSNFDWYRALEWLSFISTELQKGSLTLLSKNPSEEHRRRTRAQFEVWRGYLEQSLDGRDYAMGSECGAVDAYLFVALSW